MRHLVLSLGLVTTMILAGPAPQAAWAEEPAASAPTAEQIETLIAGLDADQFLARERAMNELIELGEPAIAPVAEAASSGSPEVALRGVYVLLKLAMSEDVALGDLAVTALDNLTRSQSAVAANEANDTLAKLSVHRQERAIRELERLGAVISRSQIQINFQIIDYIGSIEIGENWQGQPEDLSHLRWLTQTRMLTMSHPQVNDEHMDYIARMTDLQVLSLNRTSVTAEGFAKLNDLQNLRQLDVLYSPLGDEAIDQILTFPNLQYVRLYGTGLTLEGVGRLKENLGAVTIDIRRGAFLGVSCSAAEGGAMLSNVTPDSAADKAGLQLGDIITHIGGEPVGDFSGLTALVSQFAPGEKVEIQGTRQGEDFSYEVEFGEWAD